MLILNPSWEMKGSGNLLKISNRNYLDFTFLKIR